MQFKCIMFSALYKQLLMLGPGTRHSIPLWHLLEKPGKQNLKSPPHEADTYLTFSFFLLVTTHLPIAILALN